MAIVDGTRRPALPGGVLIALLCTGCPPPAATRMGPAIPFEQAVSIVNENLAAVHAGLTARGSVTGRYVDRGGHAHDLSVGFDAWLSVIAPKHLNFEIRELGRAVVVFGSNDEKFWLYIGRGDDIYRWGHHAAVRDPEQLGLTMRPDEFVEALGLNSLPSEGVAQRIENDYQQLLFVQPDGDNRSRLTKEYWLGRTEPRLVRAIIFRDQLGRVHMDARLGEYRPISNASALLPHRVRIEWPLDGGVLDLRISRWRQEAELTKDSPAFVAPHERGKTYRNIILVDPGATQPSD